MLKLSTNDQSIDKVYDILKDDLQANYSLRFELSEDQIKNAKDELIKLAIKDASQKAQLIAAETGTSIGKVLKIQYGDPKVISNFINPGFELLFKGDIRGQFVTTSAPRMMDSLTPHNIEIKTNIVIGWEILMN